MKILYRCAAGILGFLLVSLISLSGQSSWGSSVTGKITGDPPALTYTCDGKKYLVKVLPIKPINDPTDLIRQQKALLSGTGISALESFRFIPAQKSLDGGFNITQYSANKSFSTVDCSNPKNAVVGASINVTYQSGRLSETDPKNIYTIHWIQVITDSAENIAPLPGDSNTLRHPPNDPFLDIGDSGFGLRITDPYYPSIQRPSIGVVSMGDAPKHSATTQRTWKAKLYLSQSELIGNTVRIYDGIEWGYTVEIDNKPTIDLTDKWEAQVSDNRWQMQVAWNSNENRYEGVLTKQGQLSQYVGFESIPILQDSF